MHEVIIVMKPKTIYSENSNILKVLLQAKLVDKLKMNRKITKEGFDFILSPTSNQVVVSLKNYNLR